MRHVEECKRCGGKGVIVIKNNNVATYRYHRFEQVVCPSCCGKGIITSEILP